MEKKLQELFAYQKFECNPKLDQLIRETEERYPVALSDDELEGVSAAGIFYQLKQDKEDT